MVYADDVDIGHGVNGCTLYKPFQRLQACQAGRSDISSLQLGITSTMSRLVCKPRSA